MIMTKTIEEVAKRFADMNTTKQAGSSVERDNKALLMTQFFHFALEELPLSERLTAEEKERVRKEYANTYPNDIDCGIENILIQDVLERIFGADFFNEEE